jgi:hypothetical protein
MALPVHGGILHSRCQRQIGGLSALSPTHTVRLLCLLTNSLSKGKCDNSGNGAHVACQGKQNQGELRARFANVLSVFSARDLPQNGCRYIPSESGL